MPSYFKSLLIFILVAVFLLANEAHYCGCPHKNTNKECKKGKTTATLTPTTVTKCDSHSCNNANKLFCSCGIDNYPLPENGNCDDVIKYSSTTPSVFECHKMRKICNVICSCYEEIINDQTHTLNQTPTKPTLCYPETCDNATKPFCVCGIDLMHYPVPKTGNCNDISKYISTTPRYYYRYGFGCYKARTVCKVICSCSEEYVYDPTPKPKPTTPTPTWRYKCDPQYCNNTNSISKPYCACDINFDHYPVPKSGNCDDVMSKSNLKNGFPCRKFKTLCHCNVKILPSDPIVCDCHNEQID